MILLFAYHFINVFSNPWDGSGQSGIHIFKYQIDARHYQECQYCRTRQPAHNCYREWTPEIGSFLRTYSHRRKAK